jgi:FkbM family methyltransferase
MGYSQAVMGMLEVFPPGGRLLLKAYLRTRRGAPERAPWAIESLKKRLAPAGSPRTVRIGSGLSLEVDPNNVIGRDIYFHGSCEPAVARFLARTLRRGMIFVDAGANVGEMTVRAARLVGPTGRVVSLEASPATAERLERNIAINRLGNVRVVRAALCDADGPVTFHLGGGTGSGSSSLSLPHNYAGRSLTVDGIRLDTLAGREAIRRVDCIKLDVEGAELRSVRGAMRLLSGPGAPIVVFEFNPDVALRAGWGLDDAVQLFEGVGYEVRRLDDRGECLPLGRVDSNCNLVATPTKAGLDAS